MGKTTGKIWITIISALMFVGLSFLLLMPLYGVEEWIRSRSLPMLSGCLSGCRCVSSHDLYSNIFQVLYIRSIGFPFICSRSA